MYIEKLWICIYKKMVTYKMYIKKAFRSFYPCCYCILSVDFTQYEYDVGDFLDMQHNLGH